MKAVLASNALPPAATSAVNNKNIVRKSANYHPSVWREYFINTTPSHFQQKSKEWMEKRVSELKDDVRSLFHDTSDVAKIMQIIDDVQLLGVAYHFEQEIDNAINQIKEADMTNASLHEVSLRFRLLRQHGYNEPSDIFNKFKDEKGNFKVSLKDDRRGLLSLYNAAYLGSHGETIIDEAISFTKTHLMSIESQLKQPLRKLVSLSLESPLWRRTRRLLARHYIAIYEDEEERIDVLLELAKLDFNLLQSLHWNELKNLSLWWKNLGVAENLSYVRDRLAECYYWLLGVYYEPQYSLARQIATKVIALITILDDTYDVYSTLEESRQLTKAIERWDRDAVDEVPEYLKGFFLELINSFESIENMLLPENKFCIHYVKEAMKGVARNYFEEAKWCDENYNPTLEEHLQLSLKTTAYPTLTCASFVGMGSLATKEAFEWINSNPRMIKASTVICRIMDDIKSHELEQKRKHLISTVQCYMNDYQTNIETAYEKLQEMVENSWKDVNEEWLSPRLNKALLERSINFSRVIEALYKYIDAFTNASTYTKDNIVMLLVEPIQY